MSHTEPARPAPVPPPSRLRWHLAAAAAGVVLGPVGVALLRHGLGELPGGLPQALAGGGCLAVVAAVTAVGSSLGLLCAGAATLLLAAAAALGVGPWTVGPWTLGPLPTVLAAGLTAVGAGGAAHRARRAGRAAEREERRLEDPARPPRSRLRAHLATVVACVLILPVAVWLLGVGDGAALVGAALLGVAALTASVSSLGAQAGGAALVLVAVALAALEPLTGWALPVGTGEAVTLGVLLLLGGAAAHFARRHGRALERAELALAG